MSNACYLKLLTSSRLNVLCCLRRRRASTPWQFVYLPPNDGYAAMSSPTGIKQTVMDLRTLSPSEPTAAPAPTKGLPAMPVSYSLGQLPRWIIANLIKFATMRAMSRLSQTRSVATYVCGETALVGEKGKTAQDFHLTESCSNADIDSGKADIRWLTLLATKISQKCLYGYNPHNFEAIFRKTPSDQHQVLGRPYELIS